jgi:hypothetical protein
MNYALQNTRVRLEPTVSPSGAYGEHEDLVVTVEHNFYLSIPYFGRIFSSLSGSDGSFSDGRYGLMIRSRCRLPNEGVRDYVDVEDFGDATAP